MSPADLTTQLRFILSTNRRVRGPSSSISTLELAGACGASSLVNCVMSALPYVALRVDTSVSIMV